MALIILTPKYRENPNGKVYSLYHGVSVTGRTVTALTMPSADRNRLETTRVYGKALPRGQGGQIATLILGGMETSLAEMRDIMAAKQEKRFVPRRGNGEIADMCRFLLERRNEAILMARKSRPTQGKKPVRMLLPVGYRMEQTSIPGLRLRVRA